MRALCRFDCSANYFPFRLAHTNELSAPKQHHHQHPSPLHHLSQTLLLYSCPLPSGFQVRDLHSTTHAHTHTHTYISCFPSTLLSAFPSRTHHYSYTYPSFHVRVASFLPFAFWVGLGFAVVGTKSEWTEMMFPRLVRRWSATLSCWTRKSLRFEARVPKNSRFFHAFLFSLHFL